jgi:hypothetical protein
MLIVDLNIDLDTGILFNKKLVTKGSIGISV